MSDRPSTPAATIGECEQPAGARRIGIVVCEDLARAVDGRTDERQAILAPDERGSGDVAAAPTSGPLLLRASKRLFGFLASDGAATTTTAVDLLAQRRLCEVSPGRTRNTG
jgi:hypothetical protein